MSGHSKWAQIKYKKAVSDAKRGKIFSRISRLITVAAKVGIDPKTNTRLGAAIEEARRVNMPNENIERAINKASSKEMLNLKDVVYEIYGPGGSAMIITAVTDNPNRTTNEIKHILSENGAKLGEQGSAMWAFNKEGGEFIAKYQISLNQNDSKKIDDLLSALDEQEDIQEVYSNTEIISEKKE